MGLSFLDKGSIKPVDSLNSLKFNNSNSRGDKIMWILAK